MKEEVEAFGIFNDLLKDVENYEYIYEDLIQIFSDQVNELMLSKNISRAQLAENMGVSKAYITKILGGNVNISLKTIAKIADGLNAQFNFRLDASERTVKWFALIPNNHKLRKIPTSKKDNFN